METYSWILEEKNIVASFLRKDVVCVCVRVCVVLYCKKPKDEKQEFAFPFNFINVLL